MGKHIKACGWLGGLLACLLFPSISQALQAPEPNTVAPGGWVSLAFVWQPDPRSVDRMQPPWTPTVSVPSGWSVLIPPTSFNSMPTQPQAITLAVQVPETAQAGRYDIELQFFSMSAKAEVNVEAHHALRISSSMEETLESWWVHEPWQGHFVCHLKGNQAIHLNVRVDHPPGLQVSLSKESIRLSPNQTERIDWVVQAIEPTHWPPKARIPLTIAWIDQATDQVLVTEKKWFEVMTDHFEIPSRSDLMLGGHWASSGHLGEGMPDPSQAVGLYWALDLSALNPKAGHFSGSWDSKRPWQRYLEYRSDHGQVRVGHQVFGGRGVDVSPRLGEGVSIHWGQTWGLGWQAMRTDQFIYRRPSLRWGPWDVAWTQRKAHADQQAPSRWWSLSYRNSKDSDRSEPHRVEMQWVRRDGRWAGWLDHQYRVNADTTLRWTAYSVPTGEKETSIQGQGFRWSLATTRSRDDRHWLAMRLERSDGQVQLMGLQASRTRPLRGLGRLSMGVDYDRFRDRWPIQLGLQSIHHRWHWQGQINSQGDTMMQLQSPTLRGVMGTLRYRRSHQSHEFRLSFDGAFSGQWHWHLALDRRSELRAFEPSSLWALSDVHRLKAPLEDPSEGINAGASNTALTLGASKRSARGGAWSLLWQQSLSRWPEGHWQVRYRWQRRIDLSRSFHSHRGVVQGQVVQHEGARVRPISGVWVWLGNRVSKTDRAGRYRFDRVAPGQHSMRVNANHRLMGWSPTQGLTTQVTLGSREMRTQDWTWVRMGHWSGQVVWPVDSEALTGDWREYQLIGHCLACPDGPLLRQLPLKPSGSWEVADLVPGEWQWRLIGPPLPEDHHWSTTEQSFRVAPGESKATVWGIVHTPPAVDWQVTEPVKVIQK